MDRAEKERALKEWAAVLKDHPRFAKAFLAQQVILMEASEMGYTLVDIRLAELIKLGFSFPFEEHWRKKRFLEKRVEPGGVIGCLLHARDPSECFTLPHQDEWFDDPLADGKTLPPKPPVPPLRPR